MGNIRVEEENYNPRTGVEEVRNWGGTGAYKCKRLTRGLRIQNVRPVFERRTRSEERFSGGIRGMQM